MHRLPAIWQGVLARRFVREVLTLQAGSLVTMGLQFVVSVIIANLLNPEPFGVYYQAQALLGLITTFANLAVGQALVTRLAAAHSRKDADETLDIMAYFLKVGLTVGLVESAIGLLGGSFLGAAVLDDPNIGRMARILFVSPPLLVVFNMVTLALQSARQARRLTILENGALIAGSILNLGAVALGGGVDALLYTVAFTPLLTSTAAFWVYRSTLPRMEGFPSVGQIVRASLRVPYRRYFAFSALVSVDKNFANLLNLMPTLMLGRWSSSDQVAYFRVAYNLMNFLSVPLAPISRNLYATLSGMLSTGGARQVGRNLLKVTLVAGGISVAATVTMLLISPFVLMIYRPEYGASQAVIYALGLRFASLGFGVGLGPIYQVLGEMKLAVATKVVPAAIMVGSGWLLIGRYAAVGAAVTIVVACLVGDITNAVLVPWILRRASGRKPAVRDRQPAMGSQQ